MIKLSLIVGVSVLFLSSCGNNSQKMIEISASPVKKPELVVPEADQLALRDVRWIVITRENFQEKTQELFRNGEPVVFFALTERGYENLSMNINDLRTHIEQKNNIIMAYRGYYVRSEAALDEANQALANSTKK